LEIEESLQSGGESVILKVVDKNIISSPIEHGLHSGKGEPWAVLRHDRPLTNRQQALLDKLPEFNSRVIVDKSDVSMMDLAALTAKTDDEFAMFTRKQERLIVRGDYEHIAIDPFHAKELRGQGYKWSGHTHTKVGDLLPSDGDRAVLAAFDQESSVIYDAEGKHRRFFIK